jgi:predicted glycosyltransferase
MVDAGLEVTVVLGGRPVAIADYGDANLLYLPSAIAKDETFRILLDENDTPIDDAWKEERKRQLFAAFEKINPDVMLFELFPFGRRQFRFELVPLLDAVHAQAHRPRIVSSVRDVLVQKIKIKSNHEMIAMATTYFDTVLVHGDPSFITLDATFPLIERIAERVRYTGYVADTRAGPGSGIPATEDGRDEVIVSIGGGAMGEDLLRTALAARPLSALSDKTWRLLVGPNLPDATLASLAGAAPDGVIVERARPDFPVLLRNCLLSISQGGYNTLMDTLQARARALIVPFAAGEESEQTFRTRHLVERGLVHMLETPDLSPERLAQAANAAAAMPAEVAEGIDFSGAETTAGIISTLAGVEAGGITK